MTNGKLFLFLSGGILFSSGSAVQALETPPQPEAVLKLACKGIGSQRLPIGRLAEAVVYASGRFPIDVLGDGAKPPKLTNLLHQIRMRSSRHPKDKDNRFIFYSIDLLEGYLSRRDAKKGEPAALAPSLSNPAPGTKKWLFKPGSKTKIICGSKAGKNTPSIATQLRKVKKSSVFVIRSKPEDFGLGGKEREKADSFKLSLEKAWTVDDDDKQKITTNLAAKGSVGFRLTSYDPAKNPNADTVYAFASYELKKDRTDPAAPLGPDERRNENDTSALALGIVGDAELTKNQTIPKLFTISQIGYVFNFVDNSEKLRFRTLFELVGPFDPVPFCTFGRAYDLGFLDLIARCNVQIDIEGAIQTKRGLSDPTKFDDYLGAGALVKLEIFSPNGKKTQSLGSISYRRLKILDGVAPSIKRFEASLKQRYWLQTDAAVDLGFSYVNGSNPLTLKDEKKLTFELGFLF